MPCLFSLTRTPFQLLSQEDHHVVWVCTMVGYRLNEHPLSWLMKMSLQIWLAGSAITDGIITISMLYLVSLYGPFVSGPLTDHDLLPTSSAEERTQ